MKPTDQTEFTPELVLAVNESWKAADCRCYEGSSTCVTCTSVAVLRTLRRIGALCEELAERDLT